jgi:hypothetical protein
MPHVQSPQVLIEIFKDLALQKETVTAAGFTAEEDTRHKTPSGAHRYFRLAGISLLLALTNLFLARSEFGGYDLSLLIDSGWRLMNHQIPGLDFICTIPPSLYLLAEAAFRAFGVHWLSLILAEDLLYLVFCLLGLRLCRLLESNPQAASDGHLPWIYIAAQSLSLLTVNHLWHSTIAAAAAAYAILASYALLRSRSSRQSGEAAAHLGFAFAILLLSKANTAWPAVLLCALCVAREKRLRLHLMIALSTAAIADLALLTACHISIFNAFKGYLGLSNRALPRLFLVGLRPDRNFWGEVSVPLTYLALILPAWITAKTLWLDRRRAWERPIDSLAAAACLVSLVGLGTNWDFKIIDTAPFLIGAAILSESDPQRRDGLARPLRWSVGMLLGLAAFLGLERARMVAVGPWAGRAYGAEVQIHDRFFGDFTARESLVRLLSEVDTVVSRSPGAKVFFGPRMEFLYAREALTSPSRLPIWWHRGSSYPIAAQSQVDQAWEADGFDVLIFAKNDRTRFPPELLSYIDSKYTEDTTRSTIDVYRRR